LLLLYFDPQLARHLHEQDFPPELYCPQWFLTSYARSLPLAHVLRLWDMMIAVDDPSFIFYVGMCLLRRKRTELLLSDRDRIPEIMVNMQFHGEQEIDSVVTEAREFYDSTPRCFLRYLRLCCVSTTELMPQPAQFQATGSAFTGKNKSASDTASATTYKLNTLEFDKDLSLQTARNCLMLSPQELVNFVAPIHLQSTHQSNRNKEKPGENNTSMESSTTTSASSQPVPQQYVIIDIRSYDEIHESGGGAIPRAIQLEPEFLQRPDAFDSWLQHFDGTRGCNICIIDLPPARWTGVALWRRLLLGEGDGTYAGSTSSSSFAATGSSSSSSSSTDQRRDQDSKFAGEEDTIAKLDLTRPAMQLALALQAHSFPNVSVLDGGFPALVEQLQATRGTVEPVIINHEEVEWARFLRATGRDFKTSEGRSTSAAGSSGGKAHSVQKTEESPAAFEKRRTLRDLTKVEVYGFALSMAERLNHKYMTRILSERISTLHEQKQEQAMKSDSSNTA
jgi:hypothetical protein